MELSIITVNWNSAAYLLDCIASIRENTAGVAYEVIVVDNASSKEDAEKLSQGCAGIHVIRSEANLGFARANNLGFSHSIGEYVLFLNPDTLLVGPAIEIMLNYIKNLQTAGIVGCKLLNSDLSVQLSAIRRFPTILNEVLDAEYLQIRWPQIPLWGIAPLFSADEEPIRVDVISGACMLLRRKVFEYVEGFSEDYFMYGEDLDLCHKVSRASLSNYYVGGATVVHHGGKSSSRQTIGQWATFMRCNSMLQYFRKTRGRRYSLFYRTTMMCAAAGRLVLLAAMLPLGLFSRKADSLKYSASKWMAILKWATGRQPLALKR